METAMIKAGLSAYDKAAQAVAEILHTGSRLELRWIAGRTASSRAKAETVPSSGVPIIGLNHARWLAGYRLLCQH